MKLLDYIYIILSIIILFPIIYFPYSGDLWIYVTGGQVIAEGGKIFKDFVDLKPPFFFMIFSVIYTIFGNTEFNVRLAEFLIQSGIIIFLYFLMSKIFVSNKIAFYGALFYSLSYAALTHANTFHAESFLPVFILSILYLRTKNASRINKFLQGLFIGLSGGLKYTFIAIYPALLLTDSFIRKKSEEFLVEQLIILAGVMSGLSLTFILLLDPEVRVGFLDVQKFTYYYAQLPKVNFALFKLAHDHATYFLGNHLSLLFVSIIIIGLIAIYGKNDCYKEQKQVINLLVSISLLLLITVFIEKKFVNTHFTRLFIPLTFFFAIGANELIKLIKPKLEHINIEKIFFMSIIIPFVIFFSPLPRYVTVLTPIPHFYMNKDKYIERYNKPDTRTVILREIHDVVNFIKDSSLYLESDKIMVMSLGCQTLNYYLNNTNISKFPLPLFPLSGVNENWYFEYFKEMLEADILIIQKNDLHPIVSGYYESTWEKLNENEAIKQILSNYRTIYETYSFIVLSKN